MTNNTINQNLIVPEVYSELVREKIKGKVVISQFAVVTGELSGNVGESVVFPSFSYIGDSRDWNIATPMQSTELEQTSKSATIKAIAAPAVKVRDYDDAVSLGKALDEAAEQQAISIARKHDTDCIAEALTSPMIFKTASKNTITQEEIISALGLFGDERDSSDIDCLAIHSNLAASFYGMDLFTSLERTTAKDGNGITVNGILGYFLSIPVILSDRLWDANNREGFCLIMKKGAINILPKETPFIETERVANLRQTTIYCSQFLALRLVRDDAIIVMKKVAPKTMYTLTVTGATNADYVSNGEDKVNTGTSLSAGTELTVNIGTSGTTCSDGTNTYENGDTFYLDSNMTITFTT